mgnify:CR=1 FL=1
MRASSSACILKYTSLRSILRSFVRHNVLAQSPMLFFYCPASVPMRLHVRTLILIVRTSHMIIHTRRAGVRGSERFEFCESALLGFAADADVAAIFLEHASVIFLELSNLRSFVASATSEQKFW